MHHYVEKMMLVPEYLPQFQCIGPDCEDHCCKGWYVSVDKKSYLALKESSNPVVAPLVAHGISRNRGPQAGERQYAKAKQDEETGCCIMFSTDKLCHIQKELGEGYLPHTCSIYPRYTRQLFGIYQQSLTFSCPEAARKGLMLTEPMQFVEAKIRVREELIEKTVTKHAEDAALANDIRFFCINLLQHRTIPLWQRIAVLGYFCEQADQLRQQNQHANIPQLIESLIDSLGTEEWPQLFAAIQANISDKVNASISFLLLQQVQSSAEYYRKVLGLVLTSLGVEEDKFDIAKSTARYQAALELGARDFLIQHEFILENLLVNDAFTNGFPFASGKSWFDGWLWLFAFYEMVVCSWVGLFASFGQKMDTDTAVTATQSLVKSFQHAPDAYKKMIVDAFKQKGFSTLANNLPLLKPE